MTVLVGITHNGKTWLGADSSTTWGSQKFQGAPKLWRSGEVIFGATGCIREAQLVEHCTTLPDLPEDENIMRWLVNDFVAAVRATRKEHGYEEKRTDGVECGPMLLIGVRGRLFTMASSYAFHEHNEYALGSGSQLALGSLSTSECVWTSPKKRLEYALWAAIEHDIYCAEPMQIIHT